LRPYVIRLSDEVLSWLDAHRGGEPRVVLIRAILREHIRRQARAASRAEARPPQPCGRPWPPLRSTLMAAFEAGGVVQRVASECCQVQWALSGG
jgi:hypothetical protein